MIDTNKHDDVQYQLRRVGLPATRPKVRDLMKLSKEVTKFGRHSANDFYLDSAKLDCFISRWHSEIHRVMQNGKIQFVLRDNSLNGTYVNNHRILGNHLLKPGEVICFGHTNGKNLKPGDYAPQTDSEFEFKFEECPPEQEELEQALENRHRQVNHPQVDSTTDIHSPTSPTSLNLLPSIAILPQSQETPLSPSKTDTAAAKQSQASLPSLNPDIMSLLLDDISNQNTESTIMGLLPLEQISSHTNNSHNNITVQLAQDKVFPYLSQQEVNTQKVIIQPNITTREKPDSVSNEKPDSVTNENPDSGTNAAPWHTDISKDATPVSKSSSPVSRSSSHTKKRRTSESSATSISKKRPQGRKRPKPGSSRIKAGTDDNNHEDDDDEETWHYDGDRCDAYDCKRPKSKTVSWVQCDDCDDWYHTVCAGCRYDNVKRTNAEFHCGCVQD